MAGTITLGILSDIHYAGAAEQARGHDYEYRDLPSPLLRLLVRLYRRHLWLRDPLKQNHLLDDFLARAEDFDYLIANGDYSCNSGFIGVGDDAVCQSVSECLARLRARFGSRLLANYGDNDIGKLTLFGRRGGMRLASWRRAQQELALPPFWQVTAGNYRLVGFASSLVALPVFEADMLPDERDQWMKLREEHLAEICRAFASLQPRERVLLFCHDPTALPFLWREEVVRSKLPQIEQTVVGHLHSNLILWKSRILAGMPAIHCLGHAVSRLSRALNEARHWRPFNVRLCPALAGIELLKDGGYYSAELDPEAQRPARFQFHRLRRH